MYMVKKTEEKRRLEYVALKNLIERMRELAKEISEEISSSLSDISSEEIEYLLRMPCIYCPLVEETCDPESEIVSIYNCRIMNIGAVHHKRALQRSKERLRAGLGELPKEVEAMMEEELTSLRLPGWIRVIYNKFRLE